MELPSLDHLATADELDRAADYIQEAITGQHTITPSSDHTQTMLEHIRGLADWHREETRKNQDLEPKDQTNTMKVTVLRPVEIEISKIAVTLPAISHEGELPEDFPLRTGDLWKAVIDIESGCIEDWPEDARAINIFHYVGADGIYTLLAPDGTEVAEITGPVPHGLIPGLDSQFVDLVIHPGGTITNWPEQKDLSQFFPAEATELQTDKLKN